MNNNTDLSSTKKKQLFGRFHHLTDHLITLNNLLKISVSEDSLLTVYDTETLLNSSELWHKERPFFFATVKYCDGPIMAKRFINEHVGEIECPYLVVTKFALDCGATIIPSLNEVSFVFPWKDDEVIFLALNDTVMILLSWYEDYPDEKKMDILFYQK